MTYGRYYGDVFDTPKITVGDLQDDHDLVLVQSRDEFDGIYDAIGLTLTSYNYFFVKIQGGEYTKIYGSYGVALDDVVHRVK